MLGLLVVHLELYWSTKLVCPGPCAQFHIGCAVQDRDEQAEDGGDGLDICSGWLQQHAGGSGKVCCQASMLGPVFGCGTSMPTFCQDMAAGPRLPGRRRRPRSARTPAATPRACVEKARRPMTSATSRSSSSTRPAPDAARSVAPALLERRACLVGLKLDYHVQEGRG